MPGVEKNMIGVRPHRHPKGGADRTGDHADPPTEGDAISGSELLIREARRRQHRRWAVTAGVVAVAAALVAGVVFGVGRGGRNVAKSGGLGVPKIVSIHSVTFPGPFVPMQVVSAGGAAFVEGTNTVDYQDGCSLDELKPATLQPTRFSLPACGTYITTGAGLIYFAADVPVAHSGSDQFHLEVFDPATRQARLLAPVITTTAGSSRAHMDLTYESGWLWMSEYGSTLWKISPATGKVVLTITDGPPSDGGNEIMAGNPGGLWLAPGAGSVAAIYRIAPGSKTLSTIYTGMKDSSVLWVATIANQVWAAVASDQGDVTETSLKAFNLAGRQTLSSGNQQFGDLPLVGTTNQAWSIGSGPKCASPQQLWFINPNNGKSVSLTTLATPVEPCLTENPTGSQIALVNNTVLVLEATGATTPPAVLYSIQTSGY